MNRDIISLKTTQLASKEIANKASQAVINEASNSISINFQKYLTQAKNLLHNINRLEIKFQQIQKTDSFKQNFMKKTGELSSYKFVTAGKSDFENLEMQHALMEMKQCLINAFVFTEQLKKDITNHQEKYIVGIGGADNIVGILNLEELLDTVTLGIDKDNTTLKLMIGKFDILQKNIHMNNNKNKQIEEQLTSLYQLILNRFYKILNTLKEVNKKKTNGNKIHISAGYAFEVAIKSLKYDKLQRYGFDSLSKGSIVAFYMRERSNIPFFREGDINNPEIFQKYLELHPDLIADQYSVKMVMSKNQIYGPSLVTITTLKNILISVIYILSSDLSPKQIQKKLQTEIFSTQASTSHLHPENIAKSVEKVLSKTVLDALNKEFNITSK